MRILVFIGLDKSTKTVSLPKAQSVRPSRFTAKTEYFLLRWSCVHINKINTTTRNRVNSLEWKKFTSVDVLPRIQYDIVRYCVRVRQISRNSEIIEWWWDCYFHDGSYKFNFIKNGSFATHVIVTTLSGRTLKVRPHQNRFATRAIKRFLIFFNSGFKDNRHSNLFVVTAEN